MSDDELVTYIVKPPAGYTQMTLDLDAYFQERLPGWEDRL